MPILFKRISTLNLLVYGSAAGLFALAFVLNFSGMTGHGFVTDAFHYYLGIAWHSIREAIVFALYFLVIFLVFLVALSNAKNFWNVISRNGRPPRMLGKDSPKDVFKEALRILSRGLIIIIPGVLSVVALSLALAQLNAIDRARLADLSVLGVERALLGGYAFINLGNIHYPVWFVQAIAFCFDNMSGAVIAAAFIIGALCEERLREMVASFCIAMLIAVAFWASVPLLSPQDRVIDNVYALPVSPSIENALANYHPQKQLADFLVSVRQEKGDLTDLPTSTMPSAHIIWAVIVGYYLWRTRRWMGWTSLPFLLASSFGTLLFAQHYFIDVPMGILVAAFAIWSVDVVAKKGKIS